MMSPRGKYPARQHMLHLMKRRLKGSRRKINEHYNRTLYMSDLLWVKFQVGAYQYQLKHLRWYLEEGTNLLLPDTRYRHWLTVKVILEALDKEADWTPQLQGSWTGPTGNEIEGQN
ncbi:MAG: hypothetical protein R3E73_12125 [Porticoccaceae bacterium]